MPLAHQAGFPNGSVMMSTLRKTYTFFFGDGSKESARMLTKKREEFVKFRWIEDEEDGINSFFEFRIKIDDLTGDTAVVITDFAEEDEMDDAKELWAAQIDRLKQVLGA